jgi:pimeloyl-ACP methyl ester carboxylesterase
MRPFVLTTTAVALAVAVLTSGCLAPPPDDDAETVIVVHGLGRTPASMTILVERLQAAGFRVMNFGYPSTEEPIESLVARLRSTVEECCAEDMARVHFVTHSMGGLLVRFYLAEYSPEHEGRVVMLAPPNQGSEVADFVTELIAESPSLTRILGPSGSRLGTDSTGIAYQLGPADFEVGIITGNRSMNLINSVLIPGPDDGKVAVDRARLEGADAFLVVEATHTFIMNHRGVADQTIHFIREGRFLTGQP